MAVSGPQSGSQKARNALTYLRSHIVGGEWQVGELIPKEPELMELIGVGRSTVREAVRALATLGMLETVPGVGTFVRARTAVGTVLTEFLSGHDIEEVLIYRRSLEIEAAQAAALNRSEEQLEALRASYQHSIEAQTDEQERCNHTTRANSFHRLIVEASGSRLLLDLYIGVMQALNEAADRGLIYLGISNDTMLADHRALLRAIEDRDVRRAAHGMALHVDRDLVLRTDMLDFSPNTSRAETLIEAGFEPPIDE